MLHPSNLNELLFVFGFAVVKNTNIVGFLVLDDLEGISEAAYPSVF